MNQNLTRKPDYDNSESDEESDCFGSLSDCLLKTRKRVYSRRSNSPISTFEADGPNTKKKCLIDEEARTNASDEIKEEIENMADDVIEETFKMSREAIVQSYGSKDFCERAATSNATHEDSSEKADNAKNICSNDMCRCEFRLKKILKDHLEKTMETIISMMGGSGCAMTQTGSSYVQNIRSLFYMNHSVSTYIFDLVEGEDKKKGINLTTIHQTLKDNKLFKYMSHTRNDIKNFLEKCVELRVFKNDNGKYKLLSKPAKFARIKTPSKGVKKSRKEHHSSKGKQCVIKKASKKKKRADKSVTSKGKKKQSAGKSIRNGKKKTQSETGKSIRKAKKKTKTLKKK